MSKYYTHLWEFQVSPEMQGKFERIYGPAGAWSQLFRLSSEYIETLLLKDDSVVGRYLTVDRWCSRDGFLAFKSTFATQYMELDKECESLTISEHSLGSFLELPPNNSFKPKPLRGSA